jgi:hypothetical protein
LAKEKMKSEPATGAGVTAITFTKSEEFTTFIAEYTIKDDDLVFHFFLTPELDKEPKDGPVAVYWMRTFPLTLDKAAQNFFRATAPRLQAKYTVELQSWWLRAQGFGTNLDPDALAMRFLHELDKALDQQ